MTISATVIADSIAAGHRLTTLKLRYPRFIHAEELTHRVLRTGVEIVVPDGFMYDPDLSRNASSSRAIPVPRLMQDVKDDPVVPIHWGKNQPGMQAHEQLEGNNLTLARAIWANAREAALEAAQAMHVVGAHKQIVNRILEPFTHINVVVTATRWDNFFALRLHPDAQPEIQQLARSMKAVMDMSTPVEMRPGQWHLPFVETKDRIGQLVRDQVQVSAARCARTSYQTHDGKATEFEADLNLAGDLWNAGHLSPFEHQATPAYGTHANFDGWVSARSFDAA